ncbi:hypothetical protein G9A89_018971 [Geosiphon pyriformis]|nr:hypothetical protein G9A89_018971 [Geosiphon pyriformis]
MVYINDWNEYQKAAEELYLSSPKTARYVISWSHTQGQLVLKVTDDRTVLKYKTDQSSDLKKFERLNKSLMLKMQNKQESSGIPPPPEETAVALTSEKPVQATSFTSTPVAATSEVSSTTLATNIDSTPVHTSKKKKGKKNR